MNYSHRQKQKGSVMIITMLIFVGIALSVSSGLVVPVIRSHRIAENLTKGKQSYFLAESGIEDIMYRLKENEQVSTTETITLNGMSTTTTVTDLGSGEKRLVSSTEGNTYQRNLEAEVTTVEGSSFNYGMQAGTGGVNMSNSAQIIGNVYSNGIINGTSNNIITGTAISANSEATFADQSNGSGTPNSDTSFGNTANTQDVAQSFQVSEAKTLIKVRLYVKKVGTPSNMAVTIRTDNAGKPSSTTIASGVLANSSVTTSYGWADVGFTTNPTLTTGTTYWLTLDMSSTNGSNYYITGGNAAGYALGTAKIGRREVNTWNQIGTNTDLFFEVFLGGVVGKISGVQVGADARANTVISATVTGNLYCTYGASNNKSCDTSLPDPEYIAFPITEANITEWKEAAEAGGVTNGSITLTQSQTQTIGPRKVVGSISLNNQSVMSLSGVVWVTGNLTINNQSVFKLSDSFNSGSGIIIVDGTISTAQTGTFAGSGTSGSYVMAVTTSTSINAINIGNAGGSVILFAPYGTVNLSNSASAKQVTGKNITLSNTASITYETGLANVNFVTGPSGAWGISSWKEVE